MTSVTAKTRIEGLDRTVSDFWMWAYSDMHQSSIRSVVAEYIVREALRLPGETRVPFDRVDLRWKDPRWGEGRIEVKSASAVVSWDRGPMVAANPTNPTFSIRPTVDEASRQVRRMAHVFIFCFWPDVDTTAPPLDANMWEFYPVATADLDRRGQQKTISLTVVKELAGGSLPLRELRGRVEALLIARAKHATKEIES